MPLLSIIGEFLVLVFEEIVANKVSSRMGRRSSKNRRLNS